LERIKNHRNARKALLLITDGEDSHSRYTFSDIKEFAKEQDVQIFAIGTVDFGAWHSNGRSIMEDLVWWASRPAESNPVILRVGTAARVCDNHFFCA
jgi:uncharacterized protein with von Willebrand factor type A (vWA) domain